MADPTQPCTYCGAVLALSQLVKLDREGQYVQVCPDCAVVLGATKPAKSSRRP